MSKEDINMIYCETNPSLCKGNDTCAEGSTGLLCEDC